MEFNSRKKINIEISALNVREVKGGGSGHRRDYLSYDREQYLCCIYNSRAIEKSKGWGGVTLFCRSKKSRDIASSGVKLHSKISLCIRPRPLFKNDNKFLNI